jgi:hypothetical protein
MLDFVSNPVIDQAVVAVTTATSTATTTILRMACLPVSGMPMPFAHFAERACELAHVVVRLKV